MRMRKILQFILLTLPLSGCVTLSTHHTGRTNGAGVTTVFGSYNLGLVQDEQVIGVNSNNASLHIVELGLVQGWTERFDIGFKINSSGHLQFLGKYQLAGNQESQLAASVGADVGFSPGALLFGVAGYNASAISFNSFHPGKNVAITLNPRYVYLHAADFWTDVDFIRGEHHLFGYSAGVMLGDRHRFSFEISQFVSEGKLLQQQPLFSIAYIARIQK